MSEILRKIASNVLTKVPSGENTAIQSLWENSDVVIYFLRRFGCPVCRWISSNLSSIKPLLDEHNVKLVGVGPEQLGSKEFYNDKVFDGELYFDEKKQCYKDLGFGTLSMLSAVGAAFDKKSRDLAGKAKEEKLGGNMKGDFYQMGGLLIVKKGGDELLMNYKQNKASDYLDNAEILKALNINADANKTQDTAPACSTDVCGL